MLKIALLFLFLAISGYGINGLPDNTNINVQSENDKAVTKAVVTNHDTNSNSKTTSPELSSSSLSTKVPEKTATEPHKDTTTSNTASIEKNNSATTKTENFENASTKSPMNESKTGADNSNIPVTTIVSPVITKSPTTTVPSTSSHDLPTTTSLPVTTTVEPVVPVPAPKPGKWVVNETNQTCIVVNMAVQFNVSYINKENKTVSKLFNLPDNVNETAVTGECGKLEQYIRLSFNDTKNVTNTFTLHFVKNETIKQYSLHHLEVVLSIPNNTVVLVHNTSLVSVTGLSNSYRCLKQQNFTLAQNGTNKNMGYFLISDLQFQAFKTDNNKDFGEAKDCKIETPDFVPIAVGISLAGLVIIVLVAYLVARRQNHNRHYTSM